MATNTRDPSAPKERTAASEAHTRPATTARPSTRRYEARSLTLAASYYFRGFTSRRPHRACPGRPLPTLRWENDAAERRSNGRQPFPGKRQQTGTSRCADHWKHGDL